MKQFHLVAAEYMNDLIENNEVQQFQAQEKFYAKIEELKLHLTNPDVKLKTLQEIWGKHKLWCYGEVVNCGSETNPYYLKATSTLLIDIFQASRNIAADWKSFGERKKIYKKMWLQVKSYYKNDSAKLISHEQRLEDFSKAIDIDLRIAEEMLDASSLQKIISNLEKESKKFLLHKVVTSSHGNTARKFIQTMNDRDLVQELLNKFMTEAQKNQLYYTPRITLLKQQLTEKPAHSYAQMQIQMTGRKRKKRDVVNHPSEIQNNNDHPEETSIYTATQAINEKPIEADTFSHLLDNFVKNDEFDEILNHFLDDTVGSTMKLPNFQTNDESEDLERELNELLAEQDSSYKLT